MLLSLALPIALSAVALFVASFLSWMVLQLHKDDWRKMEKEDEFLAAAKKIDLPVGSYMFPACKSHAEMQSEEFQKKVTAGPRGILTIFPEPNMGKNLGLTFVYFLAISLGLGLLATLGQPAGADFVTVFRFVFLAGFMTFLTAMVSHAIWFRARIVGHVIESVAYAAITATVFAAMWPAA